MKQLDKLFSDENNFIILLSTVFIILVGFTQSLARVPPSQEKTQPEVLGRYGYSSRPRIYLSGPDQKYNSGGVIPLSSTAEPAVQIDAYNVSGTIKIDLYKADESALTDYLIHDEDGKQLKTDPDTSRFQFITTLNLKPASDSQLLLPLSESGIWFLRARYGSTNTDSFVVRSNIGVFVKEGDNEYIFWGQNFRTKKSLTSGSIRVLNLKNGKYEIASAQFNESGFAKTQLFSEADIAIAEQQEDRAIVPLNLRYLNTGYDYDNFVRKSKLVRYFVFTDRPLYKPGDTVYFKTVMRDDDDARYTIPQGSAEAKIYKDWDDQDPIFEKTYPITQNGTIYGQYDLPKDVSTGYYKLIINIPQTSTSTNYEWYGGSGSSGSSISFRVEYFRKPEYTIDITVPETDYIAGDKTSFMISGDYFFGQPLSEQKVKYTIYSADYYEYEYLADYSFYLNDDYRYAYWYGDAVKSGTATLDNNGEAKVELDTKIYKENVKTQSQVLTVEAEFDDGSGNPSFARKNILVHAGEFAIFRQDYSYSAKVGATLSLPLVATAYQGANVSGKTLTAKVQREEWISYQEPNKKYPSYRSEVEQLGQQTTVTDNQGKATFSLTPQKPGSYKFLVQAEDSRGNLLTKEFYVWVRKESEPFYTGEYDNELTIQTDKEKYQPADTVRFTISSNIPNRDVFLSLERARVNRFEIVHLNGYSGIFELPLVETDMPNIFAQVASFSDEWLDSDEVNVIVSTETKKIDLALTPNQSKYGPGDTVTLNIQTTDSAGNPVSADTGVWAVDKALFELVSEQTGDIFETFWEKRYNYTEEAHSLEGIIVQTAEAGGCFSAGTPVLMADGTTKPIEQVKPGDKILTRKSEKDASLVTATVTKTHSQEVSGYLVLNGKLKVTPNHRLRVNNSWQEAGSIQLGDSLTDNNGGTIVVNSIYWQLGKFKVYNLEIEKYKTYFAGGVWVHNQKGNGGGREIFKDTAYWNPSLQTGADGRAQVTFKLPDNLTTWVVSAIATTADTKVGQAQDEITVTQNVLVRPILPNILREEDTLAVSALVHNFTQNDLSFDIDLSFDAGEVATSDEVATATYSAVFIPAKQREQLFWDIYPTQEKEKAKLRFSARALPDKDIGDTITYQIPVRAFGFWEKTAEIGDGPTSFTLKLAPDADQKKTEANLSLASTLLGTLPSAMRYLVDYPYGCVEQTTSRFVPAVIAKANPDLFAQSIAEKDIDEILAEGVKRLVKLQQSDGGWAWWSSGRSNPFISAYVIEYLVEAQKAGVKVDKDMLRWAQQFLEQDSYFDSETQTNKTIERSETIPRIYGLSLLGAEKGKQKISNFAGLTPDLLALAVIANSRNRDSNPQTNGLSNLIGLAQTQGDGLFWQTGEGENFGSQDASTALAVRAILAGGGDRELAVKGVRFLTRNRRSDYWSNTFATAQVIRAVVELVRTGAELSPNYTYTVLLDDRVIRTGKMFDSQQKEENIKIPLAQIRPEGSILTLKKEGEGQLYSTLVIKEFHTDRAAKAASSGLSIEREYQNETRSGGSLAVGDTVTVKLKVSGLAAQERYGIIEDQLPAGLVPINPVFKSEQFGEKPRRYDYYYGASDQEITENGMILSLQQIPAGSNTYTYKARVVGEGEFSVPPATASLMYAPEINGRSDALTLKVSRKGLQTTEAPPARPTKAPVKTLVERESKINLVGIAAVTIILTLFATELILISRKRKSE